MKRTCSSMAEAADVFNHNMEVFSNGIKLANKKIARLEKKNRSFVWMGIIFGTLMELGKAEQNQRISALNDEIGELKLKIAMLGVEKGD